MNMVTGELLRCGTISPLARSIVPPHTHPLPFDYPSRLRPCHACSYPSIAQGMFPGGAGELVHHVMTRANEAMADALEASDLAALSVTQRVRLGVQARLEQFAPFVRDGSWAQAMGVAALPQNAPTTTRLLAVAADEIWYQAGDRSTDTTWYTRRVLLMGVSASTELFMLTDRSPGFNDTWAFLDRRLSDVAQLGRATGEGLAVAQAVGGGLASLATAGLDLLRPLLGPLPAAGASVLDGAIRAGVGLATGAANAAAGVAASGMPGASSSTGGSAGAASAASSAALATAVGGIFAGLASALPAAVSSLGSLAAGGGSGAGGSRTSSPLASAPQGVVDMLAQAAGAVMRALPTPPGTSPLATPPGYAGIGSLSGGGPAPSPFLTPPPGATYEPPPPFPSAPEPAAPSAAPELR